VVQFGTPFKVIGRALSDWWDAWFTMILVSLVWVLSWVTIVLGPPVTLGMYYVANQLAHGTNPGLGGLIEGTRRHFLKGLLWGLLNLGAVVVLSANVFFYGQIQATWAILLQGVFIGLSFGWVIVQFYTLPFLMEQEQQQLRLALRNALLTMLASPIFSLVMIIFAAVLSALSFLLVLPLILGSPALVAVVGNRAVLERLETFGIRQQDREGDM
jgi:uncharacterized membrane protein YesL